MGKKNEGAVFMRETGLLTVQYTTLPLSIETGEDVHETNITRTSLCFLPVGFYVRW